MSSDPERFLLRTWQPEDCESLATHANNRNVWVNLRQRFPQPFTLDDADRWVRRCGERDDDVQLAVVVDGEAVGGVSLKLERRNPERIGELGYWLGEPYWGRGIMTRAVEQVSEVAFERHGFDQVQATVRASNPASARVLEKAGFQVIAKLRPGGRRPVTRIPEFVYARRPADRCGHTA